MSSNAKAKATTAAAAVLAVLFLMLISQQRSRATRSPGRETFRDPASVSRLVIDRQRINFVTFAGKQHSGDLDRILHQARALHIFENIWCWQERNLDGDFLKKNKNFMCSNPEEMGLGIWKPQVVLQALNLMQENDVLVFADARCTVSPVGGPRLLQYVEAVNKDPSSNLAFVCAHETEEQFTKEDMLRALQFSSPRARTSPHLSATAFVLRNTLRMRRLVQLWLSVCENFRLLQDAYAVPNRPAFVKHRHHQSAWSVIRKRYGTILGPDELHSCRPEVPIQASPDKDLELPAQPDSSFCSLHTAKLSNL